MLVERRRVATPIEDDLVQMVGHLHEVENVDLAALGGNLQAVHDRVIRFRIRSQQKLPCVHRRVTIKVEPAVASALHGTAPLVPSHSAMFPSS